MVDTSALQDLRESLDNLESSELVEKIRTQSFTEDAEKIAREILQKRRVNFELSVALQDKRKTALAAEKGAVTGSRLRMFLFLAVGILFAFLAFLATQSRVFAVQMLSHLILFFCYWFAGGITFFVSVYLVSKILLSFLRALTLGALPAFFIVIAFFVLPKAPASGDYHSGLFIPAILLAIVATSSPAYQFVKNSKNERIGNLAALLIGFLNIWLLFWSTFFVSKVVLVVTS